MSWITRLFGNRSVNAGVPSKPLSQGKAESGSTKIQVGSCARCGKALRVKPTGVRPEMRLTCKCGEVNTITVQADLVAASDALRHTPRVHEDSPEVKLLVQASNELLAIYRSDPQFFQQGAVDKDRNPAAAAQIRSIGKRLNAAGGMNLMLRAHQEFRRKANHPSWPGNLERLWNFIGDWMG